jgi:hypothetical protein
MRNLPPIRNLEKTVSRRVSTLCLVSLVSAEWKEEICTGQSAEAWVGASSQHSQPYLHPTGNAAFQKRLNVETVTGDLQLLNSCPLKLRPTPKNVAPFLCQDHYFFLPWTHSSHAHLLSGLPASMLPVLMAVTNAVLWSGTFFLPWLGSRFSFTFHVSASTSLPGDNS